MSARGYRLRLGASSQALLGGLGEREPGVQAATALLPEGDGATGGATGRVALLLGSSLRGVLRHDALRLAVARGIEHEDAAPPARCGCVVCRLFGGPHRPGKLAVRSAKARVSELATVAGVSIDRRMRTADRMGRRLWSELRSTANYAAELVALSALDADEQELLELLLGWEAVTGLRLGRRKSTGLGAFTLAWEPVESGARARPPVPAASQGNADSGNAGSCVRYLVHVEAVEPLRIAGPPQRLFYREVLEAVPATTLRGAFGWALQRRGDGELAHDLFIGRPVRLTAAAADAANGLPVRWLSAMACRGPEPHPLDTTLDWIVDGLGGELPEGAFVSCPVAGCDGLLRPVADPPPPVLVIGQTEIDPAGRRARDGRLFYQATLRPGTVFTAELLALPEQAAALASLDEVLVGGNRARGLGRAKVCVEAAPELAPVAERVRRTTRALDSRGVDLGGDEVAVLGLVSDGFAAEPLRTLLERRGLGVVAGQVRSVARGSYDEQAGRPRALRTLLAAGSWVAVRGRDLAGGLMELERDGIGDPDGLQPLWPRVRGDVEGRDVARET